MKEINNLKSNKPHKADTKNLIKENFGDFIFGNYDNYVYYFNFPNSLRNAIVKPNYVKVQKRLKIFIDL